MWTVWVSNFNADDKQSYKYQVLQTTEGGGFEIFWLILTKLSKTQISNGILVINDHFTTVGGVQFLVFV